MGFLLRWLSPAGLLASVLLAQQPPVLDRELFFGDPEISGSQLSPDGKYIAFLKPLNKTRNIWVKRAAEPFSAAKPVTDDTKRPISAYAWSRDGKYILFAQDKGGDENYNVYAVDPAAAVPAGAQVPPARNLTDVKGVRATVVAVPKSAPDIVYVGLNDRDKAWHDLYRLKISTGERTLVRKNTDRIAGWVFDLKDELRMAVRSADNGDTEFLRIDPDGFKKIYSCGVFETCSPLRFHKDNKRVYIRSNKGAADLIRLAVLDPQTGAEEPVESDPLNRVDLSGAHISEVSDELVMTYYNDEKFRRYWRDKDFEKDIESIEKRLPGKDIRPVSRTADEVLWLMAASSDTEPGEVYLFDRKTKALTFQYRIREDLKREYLAAQRPVRYKSSDGLEIPAYLTLPKGVPAKNLPAIVTPHGGPWARDSWGYDPMTQFLANRGYAVLQMNFRGSTGYGKKFLNAGNKEWGQKMQDDITWGVKHLVAEGIADPKRVGIMGGSYGGYATLAGVAFTPEVYAAGVSIVGPSNLLTLLDSIPPYWEPIRKLFYERMGDPNTPSGKAQLERQSPLNSAAKIKTPLLVVQGANDPRVNKAESDQIVVALRDRGFAVEYLVAPDEGHGFARPVNSLAMFASAEKFLAKHLGGRFQEGATAEVAARLKEITVDPKTVVLAKKVDAAAVTVPKLAVPLQPGAWTYKGKLERGGQSVDVTYTTVIKEADGAWLATDTIAMQGMEIVEATTLDKNTLVVRKRSIRQGPVTVEIAFENGKATGKMTMGTQERPIAIDLGGPLFADGAAVPQVIACLPLTEGYSTIARNFDLQTQKAKLRQLTVGGSEKISVAAGSFDAQKAELAATADGGGKMTIWIAKDSRKVVRLAAVLPGGSMNAELQ